MYQQKRSEKHFVKNVLNKVIVVLLDVINAQLKVWTMKQIQFVVWTYLLVFFIVLQVNNSIYK